MTRLLLKRSALKLRRLGKSYSQIKCELGVSKSTLSEWLRTFPLSKEQIDSLRGKSEIRIEKYRQTMRKKREARFDKWYKQEQSWLLPVTKKEHYLLGLFLYWGEGQKASRYTVGLNNTDPSMILFFLYWLEHALNINRDIIRVNVHLYEDMDIEESLNFWSKTLNISRKQFTRPYIKKSKRIDLDQKGYGHGTCGLYVYDARLKERVIAGIEVLKDYYLQNI